MTDAARHLKLLIDDDGRLAGEGSADRDAWLGRLRAVAGSGGAAPRVLVATHGGLVDQARGEDFAAHIPQIVPDGWSVTLLTRTGFWETVGRELRRVFTGDVLDLYRQLVQLYSEAGPRYTFPRLADAAPAGRPSRIISLEAVRLDRPPVMGGRPPIQGALRVGDPPTLPAGQQTRADQLTARLVTVLAARLPAEEARRLPRQVQAAARDAARQGPRGSAQERTLGAVMRPAVSARLPNHFPPDLVFSAPASGGGTSGEAPPLGPDALDARLIETLTRRLFIFGRLWEQMKTRLRDLFLPGRPGADLLAQLARLGPVRVRLLGHSLGGIFVDQALRHVAERGHANLVDAAFYLAPANTLAFHLETRQFITPHFQPSPLRVHLLSLTDAEELDEREPGGFLAGLYPRSVLYLISNALEGQANTPLLGMQRYAQAEAHLGADTVAWTPDGHLLDHTTHGHFVQNASVRAWLQARFRELP